MAKWWNKKTKLIFFIALGVMVVTLASFATYYSIPMRAEQKELHTARNLQTVRYTDTADAIVVAPISSVKKGIVLYAGGRIEPAAYAYKMADIAQSGVAVVIVKSPLHLAPLDWRSPSQFTGLVPSVGEWYVAGHSVGGVRACQMVAEGSQFKGLILLGAYCASNISGAGIPVLSIGGDHDQLTTPDDINKNKHQLPTTSKFESIAGLNHSGFGDYGKQNGDGEMSISDTDARAAITHHITTFVGTKAGGGQGGAQ